MERKAGLTLIELAVVLILIVSATGVFLATYILAETSWRVSAAQLIVQRQGQISFEKMTRTLRKGRNAIIEDGGNCIRFENLDETESKIYLEPTGESIDGKIVYKLVFDNDTGIAGDEKIIVRLLLKQTGIDFFAADPDDNSKIYISYLISDTNARDRFQVIDLSTMVKLRN